MENTFATIGFGLIVGIAIYLFLGAFILKLAYNNSIPEITKDINNDNKQTVAKLGYWNAFSFLVLLGFVPLSVHTYNISNGN